MDLRPDPSPRPQWHSGDSSFSHVADLGLSVRGGRAETEEGERATSGWGVRGAQVTGEGWEVPGRTYGSLPSRGLGALGDTWSESKGVESLPRLHLPKPDGRVRYGAPTRSTNRRKPRHSTPQSRPVSDVPPTPPSHPSRPLRTRFAGHQGPLVGPVGVPTRPRQTTTGRTTLVEESRGKGGGFIRIRNRHHKGPSEEKKPRTSVHRRTHDPVGLCSGDSLSPA